MEADKTKKGRGAPKGNKNAADHGAPKGNKNAADHGAPKGNKNAAEHGAPKGNKNAAEHGAPKGSKNAADHGAPKRNVNAETHGAYSKVYMDSLTKEQREFVEGFGKNTGERLLSELQELLAKEWDLKEKLKLYNMTVDDNAVFEELFVDRVVNTSSAMGESETTVKVSAFQRRAVLEEQLNKLHSKILKCLDSLRAYELEQKRIDLDERRFQLAKQKITGEFTIGEDGEIVDTVDPEKGEG